MRHPWIVLTCAIAFGLAGAAYAWLRPPLYAATAGLVVEDARTSLIFGTRRAEDPERYVADQVAFLRSLPLATRASQLAEPDARISPEGLLAASRVESSEASNFISIRFQSSDPETARIGANSLALAYRASIAEAWEDEAATVLEMADRTIAEATAEAEELQAQIDAATATSGSAELEGQLPAIVAELAELRDPGLPPEDATARLEKVQAELAARKLLADIEAAVPVLPLLEQQLKDVFELRSQLRTRRSQLAADFRVSGDGVSLFSPAEMGRPQGIAMTTALPLGVVMGVLVGGAAAYLLDARRRRFSHRLEPEAVLRTKPLAEIPDFTDEGLGSAVPVRDRPTSSVAEAFRFLSLSLETLSRSSRRKGVGPNGRAPVRLLTETEREVLEHLSTGFPNRAIASWIGMSNERVRAHLASILSKLGTGDGDTGPTAPAASAEQSVPHPIATAVAVVSATPGVGNSTVAANLGWAAAAEGAHVLLIDAGLSDRALTRLLLGDRAATEPTPGLIEVVLEVPIGHAAQIVPTNDAIDLRVLGLGSPPTDLTSFLYSPESMAALADLRRHFDLVVIDVPPILETAYAGALIREVDLVVVVVRHGSEARDAQDLREKLDLLEIEPAGYVYSHAPSKARRWLQARTPWRRGLQRPGSVPAPTELARAGGVAGESS